MLTQISTLCTTQCFLFNLLSVFLFNQFSGQNFFIDVIVSEFVLLNSCINICIFFSLFQFYDILKPNYNTVDLTEVELVDSDAGPRESDLLSVSHLTVFIHTIGNG